MDSSRRCQMIKVVENGQRSGSVKVPASKSVVHRMLICGALSNGQCGVGVDTVSKDIEATTECLAGMGADIVKSSGRIDIKKGLSLGGECDVCCKESGSTLRFLIPVAAALKKTVRFHMEGLLSKRPHDVLTNELMRHGAKISQDGDVLTVSGELTPGTYEIAGNISSQFISGLLFALPLLDGDSKIIITGKRESVSYINMTLDALRGSEVTIEEIPEGYFVKGNREYKPPVFAEAERDWSGAAFFLCMGAMSLKGITLMGMNMSSRKGDMKVIDIMREFGARIEITGDDVFVKKGEARPCVIDAKDIPDLVPVLSVLMCAAKGKSVIKNAERLRFKESDRLASTSAMIKALGGEIVVTDDGLEIFGKGFLEGGTVDTVNDHRIAMSAATAAGICRGTVTVPDAECADKSYPGFFDDLEAMNITK